jgi:hypothetical protein
MQPSQPSPVRTATRVVFPEFDGGDLVVELVPRIGGQAIAEHDMWRADPRLLRLRFRTRMETRFLEDWPEDWWQLRAEWIGGLWERATPA